MRDFKSGRRCAKFPCCLKTAASFVEFMEINSVGVVGAGVMGTGVSQVLGQAGYKVTLVDISHEALERARTLIQKGLRLQTLFGKGESTVGAAKAMDSITLSTEYSLLEEVSFVIENVVEELEVKKDVFERLDRVCRIDCIFASNTSVIPITRLASFTNRPDKVLGMHFMNPVTLKPTVELIRGFHTSKETIGSAMTLLQSIGKEGIIVGDSPGFVINRVLMPMINEASYLVQEQVASVEDIDRIFKTCLGHKMGPLETADLIGLDTILSSIEALYESFGDSKYRPCPLLRKMVDAGLLGCKSGQGFYYYSDERVAI